MRFAILLYEILMKQKKIDTKAKNTSTRLDPLKVIRSWASCDHFQRET